ncbi:MAG: type IV secretion system DNA-binding domain-containing protein [Pseudomonadota bacterium]
MSTLFKGGLSDWIRGSQSVLHEWRMLFQSIIHTLVAGFVLLCAAVVAGGWINLAPQERHTMFVYGQAAFNKMVLSDPTRLVTYTQQTGEKWKIESGVYLQSQLVADAIEKLLIGSAHGFKYGLLLFIIIVILLAAYFYFTGREQSRESFIRGARLGKPSELDRAMRAFGRRGVLKLGRVQFPAEFEPQHSLFIGASGTGKSQSIARLLEGVRAAGQRAIVYDVNGSYVEKFYRPDRDVILNPLDARSPAWRIWNEVRHDEDFAKLAESLIPEEPVSDPFWPDAAKTLFAAAAKKIHQTAAEQNRDPLNAELVDLIMQSTPEEFTAFLKKTKAAPIADEQSVKMGLSVRATLTNDLAGFTILQDLGPQFSIRKFVEEEDHDSWLFITSKNDQLAQLRPLISLWVDTAVSTVLSLSESPDRRLWLVFDELTSLQRLPALHGMMAQARKFGGCVALGFQSFAQLCEVYRREGAEAVTGNCSTWAIMRANDRMTAEWASEALGKTEQQEANEGMSVGQHEMRDGRTLQQQRVERQLVLPSQIRGLDNLEMYLAPGRGLPVVRQKIDYRDFDGHAEPFIERTRTEDEVLRAFINDPENPTPGFGVFAETQEANFENEGKPGVSPEAENILDIAARHYEEMLKRRREDYSANAAAE